MTHLRSRPDPSRLRLLVFDLDGTLLDSLEDIAETINTLRARHGVGKRSRDEVRTGIGHGAGHLCRHVLGDLMAVGHDFEALFREFRSIYRERSVQRPRLYPGTRALLQAAQGRYELAILTNKPLEITESIVEVLELRSFFTAVLAPENAGVRKPDPAGLLGLLAARRVDPAEAVLVGDSIADFGCGKNAAVFTVGLRAGYYNPGEPDPDLWLEDVPAFHRFLDGRGS